MTSQIKANFNSLNYNLFIHIFNRQQTLSKTGFLQVAKLSAHKYYYSLDGNKYSLISCDIAPHSVKAVALTHLICVN